MALKLAQRQLDKSLPSSEAARTQLSKYLDTTGLHYLDFARRINYSKVAIAKFMRGSYHGSDAKLKSEILAYLASHPVEIYEEITGRLYRTRNVEILEEMFLHGLEKRTFSVVEGDPGTQKTFILQALIAELNKTEISKNGHGKRAYYVYCPPDCRPTELLKFIAEAAGSIQAGDKRRIVSNLRHHFGSRRVVLCLDEAQHLKPSCIDAVRWIFDRPPYCSILLAGSHSFGRILDVHSVQLEQVNGRIHQRLTLPGLSVAEVGDIARGELGPSVPKKVIDDLVAKSTVPRISSREGETYISARRVFEIIADMKLKLAKKSKKAGAA